MKKVSLRNFQLKPSNYLNDLPVTLTRYGKKVAVVVKHTNLSVRDVKKVDDAFKRAQTCKHGYPIRICQKCKK